MCSKILCVFVACHRTLLSVSVSLSNWRNQIWLSISGDASPLPSRDSFPNLLTKLILVACGFPYCQHTTGLKAVWLFPSHSAPICTDAEGYHTPDAQLCSLWCPDLKFLLALAVLPDGMTMTFPDAPPSMDLQRVHLVKSSRSLMEILNE